MDTATGSGLMEEYDLMKQSKYRVYMSNIDKALKNFEYSSEWADLISALGKLNKVISSNSQYPIIPRRIKISKRLAQCMHPALPSGVHLKALESYDVIFSNIGVDRLASELFIYSAGLFPLLGYSAMNVRPTLLSIYEKYFVPLGEKLRPALSGFLSGVFPGLESGQDHFERTSCLLDKVCAAVKPECFYTCLWECIVTNASVRLPAISYVLDHFDKKRPCLEQKELMGGSVELLVTGLSSCLIDAVILVQRNTLEFLLLAFPLHAMTLCKKDVIRLVKTALNTILRRDMSLNRRLYSWLLGADTSLGKHLEDITHEGETSDPNSYFETFSKDVLVSAFKLILKASIASNPVDLSPYRILISLLDKAEIGQRILDDVLCDIIRTISLCNGNHEVQKSANLLFSTFDPSYIWNYMTTLYRDAAAKKNDQATRSSNLTHCNIKDHIKIDSGPPGTIEVCYLTEFLLETLSLEMYNETTRVYLPKFLLSLVRMLTVYSENMTAPEVAGSLKLCVKIVSKVQPMIMSEKVLDLSVSTRSNSVTPEGQEAKEGVSLEKSNSDSKIHETSLQVGDSGSFTRSNSSQGLSKKGKYNKKSKKSKSYTKLSDLEQQNSVGGDKSATNVGVTSSGTHGTSIGGASSTPNLKNDDAGGESSQEERQSMGSDREDAQSADIVIKVPTQVQQSPAQMPDCPILEKCIKQYVLFYELYVCRQIFDRSNLESSSGDSSVSSSEHVSLQDNLFINPNESKHSLEDVFVINTLLPELEEAFQTLKINGVSDSKKLKAILAKTMDDKSNCEVFERWAEYDSGMERGYYEVNQLINYNEKLKRIASIRISESLKSALKLACNVLTEMSSFPSYGHDSGLSERCDDIPGWLKSLTILTSFVGDLDTQLSASQTLIDMVSLLRTNGQKSKTSSSGTTFVMMMPLLKLSHVLYLEKKTKVFQVLTTMLWNNLESSRSEARTISILLYRIHSCLDTRFTESVIISKLLVPPGHDVSPVRERNLHVFWSIPTFSTAELKIDPAGFRRFQLLWKLGRDTHHGKEFEKLLFLVLDLLTLPPNLSIQITVSKWLQEALVRGDIGRVLKPMIKILLNESTKRMSIIHTKRYRQDADTGSEWEKDLMTDGDSFLDRECFAVSSEDGCIRYHMDNVLSKKRSPIRTIHKKIFGVAIGSKSNSNQVSNYLTNDSAKEVASTASVDDSYTKISVIINPLESELSGKNTPTNNHGHIRNRSNSTGLIDCEQTAHDSSLVQNGLDKKEFHRSTSDIDETSDGDFERKKGRLSDGNYSRSTTATGFYESETVKRNSAGASGGTVLEDEGFTSSISERNLNYSFASNSSATILTNGDSEIVFGTSAPGDSVAAISETPSSGSVFGGDSQRSSSNSKDSNRSMKEGDLFSFGRRKSWRNSSKLYPFHSHFLIYESIFNTKQILYTLETLNNILANDSRFFLCLSVTTSVSSSQIRSLLVRHRRNATGKGFSTGQDEVEYQSLYRGCMYLEVIVTILLYYTRSYYQKDDDQKIQPSKDDINGNSKIQLECIKLMTKIFTELLSIVKDVGKNLANYIADLMEKCKVQKIMLYCITSSVNYFTSPQSYTYSEEVLVFNDPENSRLYAEAYQIELLNLMLSVIKLEHEIMIQRNDERFNEGIKNVLSSNSPTRPAPENKRIYKYIPNQLVSQQPMFLSAMLSALQSEKLKHIHKNWTDMVTSCLTCLPLNNLTNIVISIIHQICANLDKVTKRDRIMNQCTDYIVAQLEAITVLSHYCLLDSSQQISLANVFNASGNGFTSPASNSGQLINSIVNVFLSSSLLNVNQAKNSHQEVAKSAILSHLPRIIITIATLWETSISEFRHVKHQLLEFLSPISLHYGNNFLAAISVAWYERSSDSQNSQESTSSVDPDNDFFDVMAKALPQANDNQLLLVKLISGIRIMSVDSFIQTMHQVIKTPPQIYQPPVGLNLEVSALELLFYYLKSVAQTQFNDCWSSLYALLKDCLSLQIPAQFVALSILNEFVQRCPNIPFSDKKDLRDLHDVTSRLVEAISNVAGSCLEQTTWLRRNLSVKEEFSSIESTKDGLLVPSNQHYSIQAQSILACILAPLLDVAFSSQEKDKVTTIVTGVMYNIVPYLKTHTIKNIPTFHACSNLLASLSTYQYTRKAWRKDVLDLLLDGTFFQFDSRCLPYWKTILDSLMTCDNTTFRDLMNRLPLAQTGTLNIFTSKEQEYEQRALLLKRLAFVIFCSENDQYHKYMPEIQEQLANSLRLPQVVPLIQSAVFLCFRVLLLRMSADHVTSLWPIIIAEMVQVFLSIEQELMTDTEEFRSQSSQHIRMLSGLDTAWVTNTNNGLYSYGHPHWRMVQLETAKLLELGCVLPATILPHFQMYRWAFVSSQNEYFLKPGSAEDAKNVAFIPHVTRISQLMDFRYTSHSPKPQTNKGSHIMLTCQSINTLQDLYSFFSTLSMRWPSHISYTADTEKDTKACLEEIEKVLSLDFLEKMPLTK